MNAIPLVLVVMLFGTVCSSYAIDCMDVWDEESIAEMIEEERRYEEAVKAGHDYDEDDDDDEDDEHRVDNEDEADMHEQDEPGNDHVHGHHESNVHPSPQHQRHKRETAMEALSIAEEAVNKEPSDLETAETHLFRPVFRYKSQYTERRRVRTPNGGVNVAPTQ